MFADSSGFVICHMPYCMVRLCILLQGHNKSASKVKPAVPNKVFDSDNT